MPKLMNGDMGIQNIIGNGNFQFSAVRPDNLGATEYTLVTIAVDRSWSVKNFDKEMVDCIKKIVGACKKSPRAENLMIRIISFSTKIEEIHGFKLLNSINIDDYGSLNPDGWTALYDSAYSSIGATLAYAKTLSNQDFDVNGAVYIITDGEDNKSTMTPDKIKDLVTQAQKNEELESLITILVGVGDASSDYLEDFKNGSNLDQFIDIGDATEQKLAKLADFVSESISSQSQSLGTGGPSQLTTF